ncbi:tyrosine-protein phosphatase [Aliagarivorans taiwanensis]|uniref:tyrosine-protein phosphatase n=1 Tax=Aliagarivorans taiwanensis TaxID=561966 RepID=UPI0004233D66|nr:CpsB/CapC family capsule biosynthesis tyrosine phosphatase [Aliagarivorans taiwanensis]
MNFVDLHCHVLPGIDDGAKDLAQSMAMLELAQACGTKVMVATPHMLPGVFENSLATIAQPYRLLLNAIESRGLDIQLHFAAEVHLSPEIMLWHEQGVLPLLGEWQGLQVLLLELPHGHVPQGVNNLIKWLKARDIIPLIAHPERNRGLWKEPYYLQQWRRMGCLFQVTAGSFLGEFREQAQGFALKMLEQDLVDVVASDCHGLDKRAPDLKRAFQWVVERYGEQRGLRLFVETPGSIAQTCKGNAASLTDRPAVVGITQG